jgi:hypothetical protein
LALKEIIDVEQFEHVRGEIRILVLYSPGDLNYHLEDSAYSDKIDTLLNDISKKSKYRIFRVIKPPFNSSSSQVLSFNKIYWKNLFKYITKQKNIFRSNENRNLLFYDELFKIINPKIVVSIDLEASIINACRNNNIIYIEIQHGVIDVNRKNFQYAITNNVNFLVWNDYYKGKLEKMGMTKVMNVGYPSLYPLHNKSVNTYEAIEEKLKDVLVLLTYNLSHSLDKFGTISENTFKMINIFKENYPDRRIRMRLHPVSVDWYGFKKLESEISSIFKGRGVIIENPWKERIVDSLQRSEFVMGYPSATLLEAASLGIRCYFDFSENFIDCIDPNLINSYYVTFFKEIDERFILLINQESRIKLMPYSSIRGDNFDFEELLNSTTHD